MHRLCYYCVHWLLQVVTWWETSDRHSWETVAGYTHPCILLATKGAHDNNMHVSPLVTQQVSPSQNLPLQPNYNLLHRTSPYNRITTSLYRTTHYKLSSEAIRHAECVTNCTVTVETESKRFMTGSRVDYTSHSCLYGVIVAYGLYHRSHSHVRMWVGWEMGVS